MGLPVYNGGNFLAAALDSLLAQTFSDFEIIISDNGSTDGTSEICEAYAQRDARIRCLRYEENRGAAWNFNNTVSEARGAYFKWAAHDDLVAPGFLEACVEALEADESCVLASSGERVINRDGKAMEDIDRAVAKPGLTTSARFFECMRLHHRCYQVFGLMRTSILKQTPRIAPFAGSDRCLLAELSLYGAFAQVPGFLFYPRRHEGQSIEMLFNPKVKSQRMQLFAAWFDPRNKGRILLPNWRILGGYLGAIWRAPLSLLQRIQCLLVMGQWVFTDLNGAKLIRDLLQAVAGLLARLRAKRITASQSRVDF